MTARPGDPYLTLYDLQRKWAGCPDRWIDMQATMTRHARDAYGGTEVLRTESVPVPHPGPGEALVHVVASSVNTADVDHLRGRPRLGRVTTGLRRPRVRVPGLGVVGVVAELGPPRAGGSPGDETAPLRPDDRVWADLFSHGAGAFAPFALVPAAALRRLPDGVETAAAAGVPHSGAVSPSRRSRPGAVSARGTGSWSTGPAAASAPSRSSSPSTSGPT